MLKIIKIDFLAKSNRANIYLNHFNRVSSLSLSRIFKQKNSLFVVVVVVVVEIGFKWSKQNKKREKIEFQMHFCLRILYSNNCTKLINFE